MASDLYRVACWGSVPRRHEAKAAQLPPAERHRLGWAVLVRDADGATAEVLLAANSPGTIDLATIPPARILRKTPAPT